MAWLFSRFGEHDRMFISFIECKISGMWKNSTISDGETEHPVFQAVNPQDCIIHLIEPDGLRRILQFRQGSVISIEQSMLLYKPDDAEEITIDEKAQAGKGKTRDIL